MSVVINPQNCSGDCNSCRYTECVNNSKHKSTNDFQDKWSGKQDLPTGKDKWKPYVAEVLTLLAVTIICALLVLIIYNLVTNGK